MTPVFADTSFYVAILNPADSLHEKARAVAGRLHDKIVTTEFVLIEVANFFCKIAFRPLYLELLKNLREAIGVEIVPASQKLFELGVQLFEARPDKGWSLTDCTSFCVMAEYGMCDALTADHHFEQAGFRILLG